MLQFMVQNNKFKYEHTKSKQVLRMLQVDMIRNVFKSAFVYLGYNSVIETSLIDGFNGDLVSVDVSDTGKSLGELCVLLRPKYAGGFGASNVIELLLSMRTIEAMVGLCSISS